MKRSSKKFNDTAFMKDVRDKDWSVLTEDQTKTGFENFPLMTINLIDKDAILKKLTKNQEKQLLKPWVTKRIKKLSDKETKYMNYEKMKILELKNKLYKKYWSLILELHKIASNIANICLKRIN